MPELRLPRDPADALEALETAHRCAPEGMLVEVACGGGRGRTGTALACIAWLAGVPASEAVAWVRARYHPRAVATPRQRRFVEALTRRAVSPSRPPATPGMSALGASERSSILRP